MRESAPSPIDEHRLLATILDSSADAIVVTTPAGIVTSWNGAAAQIFGYSAGEMLGRPIDVLVPANRRAQSLALLAELFASPRRAAVVETERLAKDGSLVPLRLTLAAIEEAGELRGLCTIAHELTQRKALEAEIEHLSRHDRLTNVYSRREFEHALRRQIPYCRRYGSGGAVLAIGLDRLSLVNVSRGKQAADALIAHVALQLIDRLRVTDTVARLGGDRFAVLLPEASEEDAMTVAESILERVRSRPALLGGAARWITCSAGIAGFDNSRALSSEEVIVLAEQALDEAKRTGRDRAVSATRARAMQAAQPGLAI
jgi:diguanylate cyclase (GGDEF)-like protein/PAS domain S-box-containing protein